MRRNLRRVLPISCWLLRRQFWVLRMACLVLVMTCMSLSNWANASSGTTTLHYFLDTHSQLTIEDLLSNPNATQFAAAAATPLAVGFSPYPVWLKWQLTPANNHNILKLDSFLLKQIDVYEVIEHATIKPAPGEPAALRHKKIDSPRLFSNALAITPGVNSTVWVRLSAHSAIHLSATFITSAIDHLPSTDNLNLLVFAITLSLGFVGVILHTQSQQQRLSLLPLQSLLLVCSGLNLPVISQLGYTDHALTAGLLLTFFMHLHHSVREQSWWPVRQLQIVRGVLVLLLIANCWPNAPLTCALLLIIGLLAYALWTPFARISMNSNTLKMRLRMITPDLLFGFVCLGLLGLHIGTWPYPQHSEIIGNLTLIVFSMSLMLLQVRTFIDEHRRPSSASPLANAGDGKALTHQAFKNKASLQQASQHQAFKHQALNNFTPQPVWYNSALLPLVKSGMRQLDGKERLHDHLSVIQQDSNLPVSANASPPAPDLGSTLDSAARVSKSFNLRILGHDILQQLEHLCHQQQTPLLFAIKPDTHTHLIGTADALVLVLQQLTRHSLQCNTTDSPPHLKNNTVQNTISVRIEEETLPETDYPDHQHPLLLKSHLRDNSCLDEEHLHWLNQSLDQLTAAQMSQLLHAYPHLIIAKQWLEQLRGTLHIHREGSTTTCYSVSLLMQSVQIHQPEPPQSFLTLKDKRILLMTYDGEYGMTMTEQASGQDIPMSLALSISQARRNLQHSQHTDAQFDLLVFDCSQAEETLHAFINEIQSTLPGYAKTPLLLLHKQLLHKQLLDKQLLDTHSQTQPPTDHRESDHCKHAAKPSAFVQLGALITGLLNKPLAA